MDDSMTPLPDIIRATVQGGREAIQNPHSFRYKSLCRYRPGLRIRVVTVGRGSPDDSHLLLPRPGHTGRRALHESRGPVSEGHWLQALGQELCWSSPDSQPSWCWQSSLGSQIRFCAQDLLSASGYFGWANPHILAFWTS